MTLFELAAKLVMDTSGFQQGVKEASSQGDSLGGKLEGVFKGIAAAAATYLSAKALAGVLSNIWSVGKAYNQQMEDYTTNFKVMLGGNVDAAKAKVKELSDFAAHTPFGMDTLAQGTQTLLAFGIQSERTTGILKMLGDISLGDAQKMQSMATAFGKASAQGKVTGETVQTMINAGFNPLIEICKRTGESMEQVQKRMSDGKVSVEELEQAMQDATSEGGQFFNGMEEASKTLSGKLSTLGDNWKALMGKISAPFYGIYENTIIPALLTGVEKLTEYADKNEDKLNKLGEMVGGVVEKLVGGAVDGLIWLIDNAETVLPILTTIGIAIAGIMVYLNPIPAAIAAIAAAILWIGTNWKTIKAELEKGVDIVCNWLGLDAEEVKQDIKDTWKQIKEELTGWLKLPSYITDPEVPDIEKVWTVATKFVDLSKAWRLLDPVYASGALTKKFAEWTIGKWTKDWQATHDGKTPWESFKEWTAGIWEKTWDLIDPDENVRNLFGKFTSWVSDVWAKTWELIDPDENVRNLFGKFTSWVSDVWAKRWELLDPDVDLLAWWNDLIKDVKLSITYWLIPQWGSGGSGDPLAHARAVADQNATINANEQGILGFTGKTDLSQVTQGEWDAYKKGWATPTSPTAPKTPKYTYDKSLPGHAAGEWRVPYDNYLALLHRDEAILRPEQADDWRSGNGRGMDVEGLVERAVGRAVAAVAENLVLMADGEALGRVALAGVDTGLAEIANTRRFG